MLLLSFCPKRAAADVLPYHNAAPPYVLAAFVVRLNQYRGCFDCCVIQRLISTFRWCLWQGRLISIMKGRIML